MWMALGGRIPRGNRGWTVVLTLACLGLLALGCTRRMDKDKMSERRLFLEGLILPAAEIGGEMELKEKQIVAYNGRGWVDISALGQSEVSAALHQASSGEASETESNGEKAENGAATRQKRGDFTAREEALIALIRPGGRLEGYAEVVYARTAAGEETERPALAVKYTLESYPVEFPAQTETPECRSDTPVTSEAVEEAKAPASATEPADPGKDTPSPEAVTRECVRVKDVSLGEGADRLAIYSVEARGLRVEVSAPSEGKPVARAAAQAIQKRIEAGIRARRELLRETEELRTLRGPGKVPLVGAWGHLERHIDMEEERYDFVRKKF
ncbi:MAG: hypothetical protein V1918_09625 [Planctomycetota bacterium]